jgi:hypothetical protein
MHRYHEFSLNGHLFSSSCEILRTYVERHHFWIESISLYLLVTLGWLWLFQGLVFKRVYNGAFVDFLDVTENLVENPEIHIIDQDLALAVICFLIRLGTFLLNLLDHFFQIF